jgi:hypothetical protein
MRSVDFLNSTRESGDSKDARQPFSSRIIISSANVTIPSGFGNACEAGGFPLVPRNRELLPGRCRKQRKASATDELHFQCVSIMDGKPVNLDELAKRIPGAAAEGVNPQYPSA